MKEPECTLFSVTQAGPVGSRLFEQTEGPVNVGANEVVGAVNRAVHMALRGKVNDGAGTVCQEQFSYQLAIADVTLQKFVSAVGSDGSEISQITGIGELVEGDNVRRLGRKPLQHKVGADESCPAGYQNCVCHRWSSFLKPHAFARKNETSLSCICLNLSGGVSERARPTRGCVVATRINWAKRPPRTGASRGFTFSHYFEAGK